MHALQNRQANRSENPGDTTNLTAGAMLHSEASTGLPSTRPAAHGLVQLGQVVQLRQDRELMQMGALRPLRPCSAIFTQVRASGIQSTAATGSRIALCSA